MFQAGGDASSSYIPLKVAADGSGVIRGFDIFTSDGTKIFDKSAGLTDDALTAVAQATGSAVSTVSKTTSSQNDSDAQKITNGTSAQTVTIVLSKDGDGMVGFDSSSTNALNNAIADIPNTIVLKIFKSANSNLTSPTQLGSTRTLTKTTSSSNIATNVYYVEGEVETEPGFNFAFAFMPSSNSSSASSTPFNASGNIELSVTDSLSAGQVVYYYAEISGSGGNGAGSNNISDTATRTLSVTAAAGNTFTIDASGDSTDAGGGDITGVTITPGTGLTTEAGNGVTLSGAHNQTLGVITGAVADSGTALATGDQIHTFVTGQGYITGITSSNVTTALGFTPTSYSNSSVDAHLNRSSASSGQILSWNGSDYAWVADQTGGGGGSGLPSGMTYSSSILDVTGQIRATGDVTAFYSSDIRYKDNIKVIDNAVDKVSQIRGVEFDWNDKSDWEGHDIGVIAQEVEKVVPEIVIERDNGYKAVNYQKLTALLIEAVKELKEEIKELKNNK